MAVKCTSAMCTLKTPAPTLASPKMKLAWTRTSLRFLWKTLHAKPVCIHIGTILFFILLFLFKDKRETVVWELNILCCDVIIASPRLMVFVRQTRNIWFSVLSLCILCSCSFVNSDTYFISTNSLVYAWIKPWIIFFWVLMIDKSALKMPICLSEQT